jgi:mannose-6-phosphate isomerase-like protein (cupin superfamily)
MDDGAFELSRFPVHLGLGGTAEQLSECDGTMEWFQRYGADHADEGADGRLVTVSTFTASWTTWEVHPRGAELVACIDGRMTLHQEVDGERRTVVLEAGEAVVNPPGAWHTADIDGSATAFFITAGAGTEHRPR